MKPPPLLACLLAAMVAAACDDGFSPVQESELKFSVFGYLDAAADTQWIRVMPMRSAAVMKPGPLGASVMLEHVGTGRTIQLRDSVFRFTQFNQNVGAEGVFLHNYWTTERLEPGATYRFSAARDGGPPSEAVVQIPPDFQITEVWLRQGSDVVPVRGVKHVPFVGVENHYYDNKCGPGVERIFHRVAAGDSDEQRIPMARWFLGRQDERCAGVVVEKRYVLVVASGAEWPSGVEYGTGRLGLTDPPSNISNSVGYLGGTLIRRLPYENCAMESSPPTSDYCRLRYDASSAALRGTATDPICGPLAVIGATVLLRDLGPPPRAPRQVRSTRIDHNGEYEIGALVPGTPHALSIRFPVGPLEAYEEYTDTLTFAPGERATRDVVLRRIIPCPVPS